jgi:hypothetical protein
MLFIRNIFSLIAHEREMTPSSQIISHHPAMLATHSYIQLPNFPILIQNYYSGSSPILYSILQSVPDQSRSAYLDLVVESIIHNFINRINNESAGIFHIDGFSVFTPTFFRIQKVRFCSSVAASA